VSSGEPAGEFPFFDLSNLLGGAGGDPWAMAARLAAAIATDGGTEPNLDPLDRIRMEELARVAELHVAQARGIVLPSTTSVEAVTKGTWTEKSLATYRPFFERFGEALTTAIQDEADSEATEADPAGPGADPLSAMLTQLFTTMGPMLVSASAGSMLGHLGQRALGQYDLPIPRSSDVVLVVPTSIASAAEEWDVPPDDLRLWVLVHELTTHAVLSVPHVGKRVETLLIDFASAFRPNADAIADQFSSMEALTDLSQLQQVSESMSDPEVLLSMMRSPAHDLLVPQFDALIASILGFVAYTVNQVCDGLVASNATISAKFRQRWIDIAPADRFMERLLGLDVTEQTLLRGDRFIAGVVERAGDEGLERLWADELDLPTAAEVDAPGLWLARIGLEGELGDVSTDVPDDLSGLDDD
jgi:putative hydrolase